MSEPSPLYDGEDTAQILASREPSPLPEVTPLGVSVATATLLK